MPRSRTSVCLLGDTHGFLDPRVAEVADACDRVVHTGDVGGRSILARLARGGHGAVAVAGNNDTARHWGDDGPADAARLPAENRLALPGGELVVVHGHRLRARDRHRRLRAAHPDATAIACGHSHRLVVDRDAEPWVLNPGAAGRTRTHGGPACLVLRADRDAWRIEIHRFEPRPRRR
ncbi:MAG: metallophosphoesterase family protein [Halofilum sp. (in: g-proteobacteria)]|nr:metallophosphoesterase family protein [Halofilum sp. (in: g-proteobacteria)]